MEPSDEEGTKMAPDEQEQGTAEGKEEDTAGTSFNEGVRPGGTPSCSMEPSDSEDTEIAPAASELQRVRETFTPAASELSAKTEKVLRKLESLHARASELLVAAGPHRVTGYNERRALVFIEMGLSAIVASLKLGPPEEHVDDIMWVKWLRALDEHVEDTENCIESAAPPRHTLLLRAAQYRRRRHYPRKVYWLQMVLFSCAMPDPWCCRNLVPVSASDLVKLPPREAEARGVPLPVGIDRPVKKLLRWLTPQDETDRSLRIICIVGPVGIGKTTLAMELYNRLKCQTSRAQYQDLHCNVMTRASAATDGNKLLLQDILSEISDPAKSAFSSDQSRDTTMGLLVRHISERLQDKRYFIYIDDMREEVPDWAKIKGAFPDNNLGSRVLITTRTESVAWSCCSASGGHMHKMKPLNLADSERLLLTRAFDSMEDAVLPKNMKLLVDKILIRCEGVPLFITAMGDWLKKQFWNQQHHRQEEGAEEQYQDIAIYDEDPDPQLSKQLEQALSSVYDGFPYELKVLSLHLSMFPCWFKFDKDRLIRHLSDDKYFIKLVESNIITKRTASCKLNMGEAEACHWSLNYFFHQFLAFESAEMGLAFTTAAVTETSHGRETKMPRIALHHPDPLLQSLLESSDLSQTLWLAVSGAVGAVPFDKFVNLVVLDLEGWENLTDKGLLQLCTSKMLFLSSLSIRNTRVSKLPREIKKLCGLTMLDVSYTQVRELPLELFELELLEELDLRGTRIRQLPKQIVGLWISLRALLLGGDGMINSTATTTKLPHDIWHLSDLEKLATVDLTEQPASFLIALGHLPSLRVLAITWSFHQCTDRAYSEALISSIKKWESLGSLSIHCGLGCSMEFLGSMSDPPKMLEKFKVTAGRFATVPKWISELNRLNFVQITVCKQDMYDLKILGKLPQLQCLILGLDFIPTKVVVIESEGFSKLERFSVDCPMPWLSFSSGAMRNVTYLRLKFHATLVSQTRVPSGICNLARLTEVVLCYVEHYAKSPSVNMTVDEVRKQVAKHPNSIDLFINDSEDDDIQAVEEVAENAVGIRSGTNEGANDDVQAVDKKNAASKIQGTSEIEEIPGDA